MSSRTSRGSRALLAARLRALRRDGGPSSGGADDSRLAARVAALEAAVEEDRRLSQRLADVLEVVTELLVPAVDRDDERLRTALAHLGKVVPSAGDAVSGAGSPPADDDR